MSFATWSTPICNLGEINGGDSITYNVSGSIAILGSEAFNCSFILGKGRKIKPAEESLRWIGSS